MSDCISFPDITPIPFPAGLSVPSLPQLSIGGSEFCCIVKYPGFEFKIPVPIPSSVNIALAAIADAQLKLLEIYYATKDALPTCPLD